MDAVKIMKLQDILTEKQLDQILQKTAGLGAKIINSELKPASEEMLGFVGEHYKAVLCVTEGKLMKNIHLFIKIKPLGNTSKAELMDTFNFYGREAAVFKFFDKIQDSEFSGPKRWGVKAFVHNDNLLVLPDLSVEGYVITPVEQYFDMNHVLVSLESLAYFHATFANHHTEMIKDGNTYEHTQEYKDILSHHQFIDEKWLRAAAKLTANFLKEFSCRVHQPNLEDLVYKQYVDGCISLREYKETLNVMMHKDLWANNILFQYNGDTPSNAILVDFQAAGFAPPAFDIMVLLHFTTSRSFRQRHENEVISHYYSIFLQNVTDATKERLSKINYTRANVLNWCEKARLFGMIIGLTIYPFVLMDSATAQRTYDDPETFYKYMMEDRTEPVVAYARENSMFRDRLLEISEEFLERYIS